MGHRAVFTHNDMDGLTCALLTKVAMPDAAVYFCEYSMLAPLLLSKLDRFDTFWLTDLSLKDDAFFAQVRDSGVEMLWFDHHASSDYQPWMAVCRIDLSGNLCAAEVVRDYLVEQGIEIPIPLQTLVEWTHDQDLWRRQIPEAADFSDILGHLSVQELYDDLSADLGRVYQWTDRMTAASRATQEARQRSLDLARSTVVELPLDADHRVLACLCWGSVNEVGDALSDARTLVAMLDLRQVERGQVKFSFRTKSNSIEAHRIAETLGGGGHAKAAGAPLERAVLQSLTSELARRVVAAAATVGEA